MMRTFTIGFKIIRSQIAPILTESTSLKSQTNSKSKCQMKSKCLNAKTTSLLFELWALLFGFLRFPRLFYVKLTLYSGINGNFVELIFIAMNINFASAGSQSRKHLFSEVSQQPLLITGRIQAVYRPGFSGYNQQVANHDRRCRTRPAQVKLYLLLTADGIQDVDLTIEVRRIDNTLVNYRLCPVPIPAHEFPF